MRVLLVVAAVAVVGCKKDGPVEKAAPALTAEPVKVEPAPAPKATRIELKVTEAGFEPGNVTLKKDQPVTFVVTRVSDATCATELLIAGTEIKADLPLNKPVEIAWTPTKAGQVKFGCAMDMMVGGVLLVE